MPRKKSNSSFISDKDEEDDIPLKVLKRRSCDVDPYSYDSLCMPSEELCELCDRVSRNKYCSLIHNVRHIIIPLLNQKVCQCGICLHHFTSQNDLKRHMSRKHSLKELIGQTDLVKRNFNNPKDHSYESDLISIVKEEKNEKSDPIDQSDKIDKSELMEHLMDTKNDIVKLKYSDDSSESFSLKNRLVFEEDIISLNSDRLLTDLTTDCQVKVELFPPIWDVETLKSVRCDESDCEAKVELFPSLWDVEVPKSVGYNELVKPGVFRCRKCGKTFPSRYEAIIHEAHHITINVTISNNVTFCKICNLYIVGDYSKVIKHNNTIHSETNATYECISKEINHNYTSHSKTNATHDITREHIGGKIKQNGVYEVHHTKITSLKLCEMCFLFCKKKLNVNYNCVQELREQGKRYMCDKCGVKFFDIYLVNREVKFSSARAMCNKKKHKKGISNEDRLKIIQKRLKLMKKNYIVVLFTR